MQKYQDRVRIVYRDFPINERFILVRLRQRLPHVVRMNRVNI